MKECVGRRRVYIYAIKKGQVRETGLGIWIVLRMVGMDDGTREN